MTAVYLNLANDKLLISFERNPHIEGQLRKISGARFNKSFGRWEAQLNCYSKLLDVLDDVKISKAVIEKFQEEADLKRKVEELKKKDYVELTDYTSKANLMSHQKKAFELHRLLPGSANTSEMGSGKCKSSDSLDLVNGELITSEKLWINYAENPTQDGIGWWADTKKPLFVSSIDQDGKIVKRQVKRLYRQQVNESLRKVHLDDGSEITITKAHKLYNSNRWEFNLNVGDRVCVPRFLPHEVEELDPDLAELFGWMVGDGCERGSKHTHKFTQKDDIDRERVKQLFDKIFLKNDLITADIREYRPTNTHKASDLIICDEDFKNFCESHGYVWGKLSAEKQVPSRIMQANEQAVARFLQGYFDAEGSVSNKDIEVSSASQLMLKQVNVLLRRFGIWLRTRKKRARATNGKNIWRWYWVGAIGGPSARIFREKIGFSIKYKQEALNKLCELETNSNTEGLPACKILQEIISTTKLPITHILGNYTVYVKGTQEPSRKSLAVFISNIDKILDGRKLAESLKITSSHTVEVMKINYAQTGSYEETANKLNSIGLLTKNKKQWYGSTVKIYLNQGDHPYEFKDVYDTLDKVWLKTKRDELFKLIIQEVHYPKIKSIEEIPYNGWVYDLEVEPDNNYVAENIICHNTASAICIAHWRIEMGHTPCVLVVCPKSVMRSWEEQIEFFSDLTYVSIVGLKKENRLEKLALKRNIYLINYEYTWRITEELLAKKFNLVIADEAHRIKNSDSNQSKACYALGDVAEYRIALTGTPVLNNPIDAFGVMRFIDPSVFGESFYSFRSKYFMNVGNENSPIPIFVPKHGTVQEISDKFESKTIRYLKEQCLDLPPQLFKEHVITLSPEQDRAYRKLQEELCAQITETQSIRINHVLTLMLKLNQVTSGWVKDPATDKIIHFKQNPKFEELKEVIDDIGGHNHIIIWAYYKEDVRMIVDYYSRCLKCKNPINNIKEDNCPKCNKHIEYRCSEIQGSTKYRNAEIAKYKFTPEERSQQRIKFKTEGKTDLEIKSELGELLDDGSEPPQTNIIVNNIMAASEGVNLQISSYAVYYSRNYSLKDWLQSLARNHRKGTTNKVTYISLVARLMDGDSTVDQRIADALKRKEDLSRKFNKDDLKLLTGRSLDLNIAKEENQPESVEPDELTSSQSAPENLDNSISDIQQNKLF